MQIFEKDEKKMTIGEKIRLFAEENFNSLNELSKLLDMNPTTLQFYLKDKRKPGSPIIYKLIRIGLNANWLLSDEVEHFGIINAAEYIYNVPNNFSEKYYSKTIFGRTLLYYKHARIMRMNLKSLFIKDRFNFEDYYDTFRIFSELEDRIEEIKSIFSSNLNKNKEVIDSKSFIILLRNIMFLIDSVFKLDKFTSIDFQVIPDSMINTEFIHHEHIHIPESKKNNVGSISYLYFTQMIQIYKNIVDLLKILHGYLTKVFENIPKLIENDNHKIHQEFTTLSIFMPKIEELIIYQFYLFFFLYHYIPKDQYERFFSQASLLYNEYSDFFFGDIGRKDNYQMQFSESELQILKEIIKSKDKNK